jgi:hypothetical protein
MIVKLNDYVINDGVSPASLGNDGEIDGLELPSIRTSSGNYSGRNGGYVGAQFFAARSIGLQGKIFSADLATAEQARRDLQTLLATALESQDSITVSILTNAGHQYVIDAYLIDFQMPITGTLFSSPFQIELMAPDPTIYDNATGSALTATVPKLVSGGYTYPVVFPVIYTGGGSPTTITNSGDFDVYPLVTMTGAMNNPVLTNLTTSEAFSLTGLITGPGDTVVVDMNPLRRTVTLNGSSIFGLIGSSSTFWSLQPGGNDVTLTTPNSGDTVSALFSWRPGYLAI